MGVFTKKEETPAIDLSSPSAPATTSEKQIPVPPAALSPEVIAYMNSTMAAQLKDLFAQLAEAKAAAAAAANTAMTPENLANAFAAAETARRVPDPDKVAREKRERAKSKKDIDDARKLLEQTQAACDHRYPNGGLALAAIRNRPDRQTLLVCLLHHCMISPRMWVLDAPDREGNEQSHIQDAHPQYVALMREYQKSHQE